MKGKNRLGATKKGESDQKHLTLFVSFKNVVKKCEI